MTHQERIAKHEKEQQELLNQFNHMNGILIGKIELLRELINEEINETHVHHDNGIVHKPATIGSEQ